jgi:hypothetical protein
VDLMFPKKAVKPLIAYCNEVGWKTGVSGAEVFKRYLVLMKKFAAYFFGSGWQQGPARTNWLSLEEVEAAFVDAAESYEEEKERFTVVCLRRNMNLDGFDGASFDSDFEFYGRMECRTCVVKDAMYLRDYFKKMQEMVKMTEEKLLEDPKDPFWGQSAEFDKSLEEIRKYGMRQAELRLWEENGLALGKECVVKNRYLCPFDEGSEELVQAGEDSKWFWNIVEFYDRHWNRSKCGSAPACDAKWYHYNDSPLLDVTSYEDMIKALADGRIRKIYTEYLNYEKSRETLG